MEASTRSSHILEAVGCGIAFFDYDHDGWLDILVLGGTRFGAAPPAGAGNRLYKNNRDGTFADVTAKSGLARPGWVSGVAIGDYNNDGLDDLFLTYYDQNVLFRNNGDGSFTDVTREAGLMLAKPQWSTGCTFVDYDRDGHLDLFFSTYVDLDTGHENADRLRLERNSRALRPARASQGALLFVSQRRPRAFHRRQ